MNDCVFHTFSVSRVCSRPMFCQSCGSQIAEDARFCNKCGARIAKPGMPGGLLTPAPQTGASMAEAEAVPKAQQPAPFVPPDPGVTARGGGLKKSKAEPVGKAKKETSEPPSSPLQDPDGMRTGASPSLVPAPTKAVGTPEPGTGKPAIGHTMMMGSELAQAALEAGALAGVAASQGGSLKPVEPSQPVQAADGGNAAVPSQPVAPVQITTPEPVPPTPKSDTQTTGPAAAAQAAAGEPEAGDAGQPVQVSAAGSADNAWVVAAGSQTQPAPDLSAQSASSISMERIGVQPTFRPWMFVVLGVMLLTCVGSGIYLAIRSWGGASDSEAEQTVSPESEDPSTSPQPMEAAEVSETQNGNVNEEEPAPVQEKKATAQSAARVVGRGRTARNPRPQANPRPSAPTMSAAAPTMTTAPAAPATTPEPSTPTMDDSPAPSDETMGEYVGRVRFVVRRYYAARAQSCFDHASRNAPAVRGRVVVRVTIGASGQVSSAAVKSNSTGSDALGRCILGRVGSWRLPEPPGGEALTIEMPFSS